MAQYNNPTPVAVAVLRVDDDKVLLIRRGNEPHVGGLAFPGGYVDELETAEMAVARELKEETGLDIPSFHWTPFATRITPRNCILIFLKCDISIKSEVLTLFTPNAEVLELLVGDETTELIFNTHDDILKGGHWK